MRSRISRAALAVLMFGSILAVAAASTNGPAGAAGTGDDYPAYLKNAAQDSVVDPWSFYNRECVSFAAWRLNQQGGHSSAPWSFLNNMRGPNGVSVRFSSAYKWDNAAAAGGWVVNTTPAVGSIAQWNEDEVGGGAGWSCQVLVDT